jgi:hypothetical protein
VNDPSNTLVYWLCPKASKGLYSELYLKKVRKEQIKRKDLETYRLTIREACVCKECRISTPMHFEKSCVKRATNKAYTKT